MRRIAEIVGTLAMATDLGLGLPIEHAIRACLMSIEIGRRLGMAPAELSEVYYLRDPHSRSGFRRRVDPARKCANSHPCRRSFLAFSAVCLSLVNAHESAPSARVRRPFGAELHDGLYLAIGHRLIRPLLLSGATYNFFAAIFTAVYTLFMVRELGLPPASIGAIVACGGVGGVLGGIAAQPVAGRVGIGRAIVGARSCWR